MDSFIKKIVDGKVDNSVHRLFQKYSKGEFKNKALIKASKSKDKYSIATSPEYANEFVKTVAETLEDGEKVNVSGAIVSTRDLTGEIEFKEKKQFQGVKRYILETEMSKEEILNLCDEYPNSFLALSFSSSSSQLKITPKAPKSGKPKKGEDKPKINFCKLKTTDEIIAKGILFGLGDFKKAEIYHDFIITDITIPAGETDPAKMRENAIRKGKIIRKLIVDEKESTTEIPFEA